MLATLAGHAAEVYFVAFSPDGKTVATASVDQTVKLWNAASGQELRQLQGHGNRVQAVALSDSQAATASWDRTARLWDWESGALLATLPGNQGKVLDAVFSPDGRWLATAGEDGTVRIYAATLSDLALIAGERLTRSWSEEECQLYLARSSCAGRR